MNPILKDLGVYSFAASSQPSEKYAPYHEPLKEPSTAMRAIIAENCSMAGGTAAILLQIALRGVGLGVSEHSGFTRNPVQRARRSLVYIYVLAFGTPFERRVVSDATHLAHSRVKSKPASSFSSASTSTSTIVGESGGGGGGDDDDGYVKEKQGSYDANDPDLQLWVAATMYWSLVTSYEDVFGALNPRLADEVYCEFSIYATALRVTPAKWPADRAAFGKYWEATLASLDITPQARQVAQDVLYPRAKNLPWFLWVYAQMIGPGNRATTTEYLPEKIRNAFGIPSTVWTRTYVGVMRMWNRVVYPLLPIGMRHFLKEYYLRQFRKRLAMGEKNM
jgi:uncharacterized protein (DUF2236 family)